MKNKIVAFILITFTLFSAGCSNGNKKKGTGATVESFMGGEDFVVFADLPCTGLTEKNLQEYLDCGFNVYQLTEEDGKAITDGTQNNGGLTDSYYNALSKLKAMDIDVFLRNHRNDPDYFVNTGEDWDKERTIYGVNYKLPYRNLTREDFADFDNLAGFFICDEPAYYAQSTSHNYFHAMAEYEKTVDWFNEYFSDKYFHMNLLPRYPESSTIYYTNPVDPLDAVTYEEYVDYYVEHFAKKIKGKKSICLDNYPFRTNAAGIGPSYYNNLLLFANKTRDCNRTIKNEAYKANFGVVIQSFYDTMNRDIECAADISFQLCVAMAMGARTFQYYLYSTIGSGASAQVGIMSQGGGKRIYNYVKEANNAYLSFADVLTNFEWQGCMPISAENETDRENVDGFANMLNCLTMKQMGDLKGVQSYLDCLVGYYKKGKPPGYMVANCTLPSEGKRNTVILDFPGYEKVIIYHENGEYETKDTVGGRIRITLEAGDGAFVVPV